MASHLCEAPLSRGHELVVLDDLSTVSRDNVAHLIGRTEFRFVLGDVTALCDVGAEWILHLALVSNCIVQTARKELAVARKAVGRPGNGARRVCSLSP